MNLEHTNNSNKLQTLSCCLTVLSSFSSSHCHFNSVVLGMTNNTVNFHNIFKDYTELNLSHSLPVSPSWVCRWQRAVCRRPAREKCSRFIMILLCAVQCPHKRLRLRSLHKSALTHLMKLNFPGPTEAARFTWGLWHSRSVICPSLISVHTDDLFFPQQDGFISFTISISLPNHILP